MRPVSCMTACMGASLTAYDHGVKVEFTGYRDHKKQTLRRPKTAGASRTACRTIPAPATAKAGCLTAAPHPRQTHNLGSPSEIRIAHPRRNAARTFHFYSGTRSLNLVQTLWTVPGHQGPPAGVETPRLCSSSAMS